MRFRYYGRLTASTSLDVLLVYLISVQKGFILVIYTKATHFSMIISNNCWKYWERILFMLVVFLISKRIKLPFFPYIPNPRLTQGRANDTTKEFQSARTGCAAAGTNTSGWTKPSSLTATRFNTPSAWSGPGRWGIWACRGFIKRLVWQAYWGSAIVELTKGLWGSGDRHFDRIPP